MEISITETNSNLGAIKMSYRIFRLTPDGFLKDIAYRNYDTYLEAERVVKELKKNKEKRFIILSLY